MNYKITIALLITIFSISCLPKPVLNKNKKIASIDLSKDINIYQNEDIDLSISKIYSKNNSYYFGDFYYATDDNIYMLDIKNKQIIDIDRSNTKLLIPVSYDGMETSSIELVDDDNNIYITRNASRIIENLKESSRIITRDLDNPEVEGEAKLQETIYEVTTNYIKADTISLTKLDSNGNVLLDIPSIGRDDDKTSILKIISTTNFGFAVLKSVDSISHLDTYNRDGKIEDTINLSEIETLNMEKNSYSEITDIVFMPDKNLFAILVIYVEDGMHTKNIIYTINSDTLKINKDYDIPADSSNMPIGITKQGTIISSGSDASGDFLIKSNPFRQQKAIKEYLVNDGTIRKLETFDTGVYGFNLKDDIATFYIY